MELINHGGISKKIKGYLDSSVTLENELTAKEREREFAKLVLIFGNSLDSPSYLSDFKKILVNDKVFYRYSTKSADKLKETNYLAICESEKPLLLVSHSVNSNNDARYVEESFSTYDSESKKLSSRIKSSLMIFGDSAELAVSVLDGRKDGYYNKNYKFYYNVDKIVVYQIENDKFFNQDDIRLELAFKNINNISKKIDARIDEVLDINQDFVKEYHIKRKKEEA